MPLYTYVYTLFCFLPFSMAKVCYEGTFGLPECVQEVINCQQNRRLGSQSRQAELGMVPQTIRTGYEDMKLHLAYITQTNGVTIHPTIVDT